MRKRTRIAAGVGLLALAAGAAAAPSLAATKPGPKPRFAAPVKLTVDKYAGGYEPGLVVDRFGNVVVTAHKQNHSLVLSPDSNAATKLRSQSWIWYSSDGRTFHDMPGTTAAQEQNMEFGDEGDVAVDATGHLYFVDTHVVDNSFTRWKATGKGRFTLETTRPIGPFGEPVDDRPWIAAHGDGVVLYAGNQGDKVSYPAGTVNAGDGDAYGPGRYTVYMSYDHGDTFDPLGVTLGDSGWCRPAADRRTGSRLLYVLCTNDGGANDVNENAGDAGFETGTLWSYVSADDGHTWKRYRMGSYRAGDPWSAWPSVTIAKDGTLYALYVDSESGACSQVDRNTLGCDDKVTKSHAMLYTSKNQGRNWTAKEVTPTPGLIRYSWLDVAPDGTLGIAYYHRPNKTSDWSLVAATAKPGRPFASTLVAPRMPVAGKDFPAPFGDFFMCAFGPDSKLHVAWTSLNDDLVLSGLNTDIYYAKQL